MSNERNQDNFPPEFGLNRFDQMIDNITSRIPTPVYRLAGYVGVTALAAITAKALLEHDFAAAAFEATMTTVLGSVLYLSNEPQRLRTAYGHMQERIFEIPYREYAKQASLNLAEEMDTKLNLSEKFNFAPGSTKQKLFHTYLASKMVSFDETMPRIKPEYDINPEELNDYAAESAALRAHEGDTSAALDTLIYEQVPLIHQGIGLEFDDDISKLEKDIAQETNQGHWAPRDIEFAAEVLVHSFEGIGKYLLVMEFLPEALRASQTAEAQNIRERYMRRALRKYLAQVNETLGQESFATFWQEMHDPITTVVNRIIYSKGTN